MATARRTRRASVAPSLEALEGRLLLTISSGTEATVWAATTPVNPSSTVLLKFNAGTSQTQIQADLDVVSGRIVTQYPNGPDLVAIPPTASLDAALSYLKSRGEVAYAETDAIIHATGIVVPNDPKYAQLWGLPMIDAPSAWGVTTGTSSTVIAVLDTGIDFSSPDLVSKIWTNPLVNHDGLRNALHGWNFLASNANVQDDDGHGSHVAGILAASGNNGIGVVGVDWNAQIMPVKVLDSQGNGTTDAAISGVYFAVQHGAKVINASWGGDVFSQAMLDALNYANSAGVVFVTAAGNESSNNDAITTYPASYRTPNELVVAAIDSSGNLASFSNFGPTTVDVAAPGVGIVSTVIGGYASYDGTSMATPYVSGTVALLAGLHPELSAAQLVARVRATAKPLPALSGLLISPGVVDPYYALLNNVGGGPVAASTGPLVLGNSSLETIEATILSGDAIYAALGNSASNYVAYLYQTVLGRAASPTEISFFAARLQSGVSRLTVINALQFSTEGLRTRVARWYINSLGSTSTLASLKSDPGVSYWAGLLANGQSDNQVRAAILSSDNVYTAFGGTPYSYVSALYPAILGRPADITGRNYLIGLLINGTSRSTLVQALMTSNEGKQATIAGMFLTEFGWAGTIDTLKSNPGVTFWARFLGGS